MDLKKALKNALRKIIGWTLVILSVFFFISTFILLAQGDFGSFLTGLLMSLFVFGLGLSIQTNLEKKRERLTALMERYFPRCSICKSNKGYEVRGLLPSSQYIRCRNCGAEWTSRDFVGDRGFRTLKLWKSPDDPKVYAEFFSQSPLKPRKTYSTRLWQALMNNENIQLPAKTGRIQLGELIPTHKTGFFLSLVSLALILIAPFSFTLDRSVGCFSISFGASLALVLVGFYGFTVSKEDSYILFWGSFLVMFFGLMAVFQGLI